MSPALSLAHVQCLASQLSSLTLGPHSANRMSLVLGPLHNRRVRGDGEPVQTGREHLSPHGWPPAKSKTGCKLVAWRQNNFRQNERFKVAPKNISRRILKNGWFKRTWFPSQPKRGLATKEHVQKYETSTNDFPFGGGLRSLARFLPSPLRIWTFKETHGLWGKLLSSTWAPFCHTQGGSSPHDDFLK